MQSATLSTDISTIQKITQNIHLSSTSMLLDAKFLIFTCTFVQLA